MIEPLLERFNWILANQPDVPLTHDKSEHKKRYNWCDALFMAPPVWTRLSAITGDPRYLAYANKEWWATTEYLYDQEEHLYFRDDRYFDQREANGKKIFWCRGNGWVFGGIVRVLESMPLDFPDRAKYVTLYKEMAAKLLTIQGVDGLWRSSLLDPVTYPPPEASGSGFFCYGLAWGVNRGLLDAATYGPAALRAWQGLTGCVQEDDMLGWIQPIGAAPGKVSAKSTEIYGIGSFLLAGSEIYKMAVAKQRARVRIHTVNPIARFRHSETLSVRRDLLSKNPAVYDFLSNSFIRTQVSDNELLFQADFAPGEQRDFWIMDLPREYKPPTGDTTTFARFVPERMDDFAWENDKVAFRMYGKALEVETVSSGIDVWSKCVPTPVVNKWYKNGDYHKDHGEGADFYKVGPTLGCGGIGIYRDGTMYMSRNFSSSRVLAEGPIRTVFELTFDAWDAGGSKVSEVKRISLDLGSHLNRVESRYTASVDSLDVVMGIVTRKGGQVAYDLGGHWLGYWEPTHPKNGTTGCGIVCPAGKGQVLVTDKHLFLTGKARPGMPFVYYTGACWDKSKDHTTSGQWSDYLALAAERLAKPIDVRINH